MANTPKILGQLKPSATTLTDLYTVPASTNVVSSTLVICNQSATTSKVRVSIALAGAADDTKQYLIYDTPIAGNDFINLTIGITLAATDKVRVYTEFATVSFNLLGTEITA